MPQTQLFILVQSMAFIYFNGTGNSIRFDEIRSFLTSTLYFYTVQFKATLKLLQSCSGTAREGEKMSTREATISSCFQENYQLTVAAFLLSTSRHSLLNWPIFA